MLTLAQATSIFVRHKDIDEASNGKMQIPPYDTKLFDRSR